MGKLRLVCPKNPEHKEFAVMAHVSEEWKVDEHAEFLARLNFGEVVHHPSTGDMFTCLKCGTEAKEEE